MKAPSFPANEAQRLAALHATQLLGTEPEDAFDRITRLAARVLGVPVALISLVDKDVQWFKSRIGIAATGTPRNISFCAHALLGDEPLVVSDARSDPRFADNPLVTGAPHIRFYAGVPLHSTERMKLGTLCVIDHAPRAFSAEDLRTLCDLARSVEELIHQRQLALASSALLQSLRQQDSEADAVAAPMQKLAHLLSHDHLTGLPNRARLLEAIRQDMDAWKAQAKSAVVACLDLDNFKDLSQLLGYHGCDRMLISVARNIETRLRKNDMLARSGSDEFLVLIEDAGDQEQVLALLRRIMEGVSRPLSIDGQDVSVSCSIGLARYPQDGADPDALLNAASTAMRQAKKLGKANIQRYSAEFNKPVRQRMALESQLRGALQRGELELHYQPKLDLRSGRICGVEALLRWHHPELGMVAPGEFIPIAEETGLIVPIGDWVLRTACKQLQAWDKLGLSDVAMAVNISSRQFMQHDLVADVAAALKAAGIAGERLELELTESLAMNDPVRNTDMIRRLKALGLSLSLDDFGTGYSSLNRLKRLPIDKIKIDRSFVMDMNQDSDSLAIVQAIIAMARCLRLEVIAEGVETEDQKRVLAAIGCDQIQGYLLSRPLPARECTWLLLGGTRLALAGLIPDMDQATA